MATSMRVVDAADLLKVLTQTTADTTPDNPAELLSDYVPAPETGSDDVAVTDSVSLPNAGHSGTYTWGGAATIWGLFQWS